MVALSLIETYVHITFVNLSLWSDNPQHFSNPRMQIIRRISNRGINTCDTLISFAWNNLGHAPYGMSYTIDNDKDTDG